MRLLYLFLDSKAKAQPIAWGKEEKCCVFDFFKIQIRNRIVPGKRDCLQRTLQISAILSGRDWQKIKYWVINEISQKKENDKMKYLRLNK